MRGVPLALTVLTANLGVATAQPISADLQVQRDAGAEECADEPTLRAAVENILQRKWSNREAPELGIQVRFEHRAGSFVAHVSARGSKAGERLLRDVSASCSDVSRGAAIAVALILDSENRPDALPSGPASVPPASVVPVSATQPAALETVPGATAKPRSAWSTHLELAGGAAYGLGGTSTAIAFFRGGARTSHALLDLGGGSNWPVVHGFDGGSVRTQLLFGSLRGCYTPSGTLALGPCVQFGAGRLQGRGKGYGQERVSNLPWYALGIGLRGQLLLSRHWFATAEATCWLPSERQRFAVQNSGIAWESKMLAGSVGRGLGLRAF